MNISNVKKLIKLFEQSNITELSYADEEFKLTLKYTTAEEIPPKPDATGKKSDDSAKSESSHNETESTLKAIKSPMVGTFYRAPSPGAKPFVEVGKTVNKGDTLCIIEAMKIMNEIEAEFPCIIRKINVENAQKVEYGTVLFLVEPL